MAHPQDEPQLIEHARRPRLWQLAEFLAQDRLVKEHLGGTSHREGWQWVRLGLDHMLKEVRHLG